MAPIRVAILGQGRSGRDIHAFSLQKLPELYQIVAVVDDLPMRRERAEQELGCVAYADAHELFKRDDIDLVVNALPSAMHVPVTLEFLQHGFNVLCEKPLARRAHEVDTLIEAAKAAGKTLAIFQQSRFSPAFQQVKRVLDSGVLGRVVRFSIAYNGFARRWDWQTLKAMNGGNLLNTGPHPVDQALQIFGTDVMPKVWCHMDQANTAGDAEDYVKLILQGEGRPIVDVEISSCEAYPQFTYHVQATNGGLTGNLTHLTWRYFRPEEATLQTLVTTPLAKADGTPAYCGEELKWYEESWDIDPEQGRDLFLTMAHAYYRMLYAALTEGAPLTVTPEQVRQQIAVMEECFRQNPRFAI
ncbi:MAG: Gfo/Idh/MocA family oxidoreductase [Alicyclobacillus sp.]|nr:Gfo/Idh/MocA family oxidoreductase [Alicyclobacillus sp.]